MRVEEPLLLRVDVPLRGDEPLALLLALRDDEPLLALRDVPLLRDEEPLLRDVLRDEPPLLLFRDDEPPELRDEPPLLLLRDDDERRDVPLRDDELREDELRDEELREVDAEPGLRSLAGTSSWITARMRPGICFSMNFCIRSSWRRYSFASFTVSLSPSWSAAASITL